VRQTTGDKWSGAGGLDPTLDWAGLVGELAGMHHSGSHAAAGRSGHCFSATQRPGGYGAS
jgi:hypothetical protein